MAYKKTVYIAPGAFFGSVVRMFRQKGWLVVEKDKADFLCLTGGGDISPSLYGEQRLDCTSSDIDLDKKEMELISYFKDKPKIGICRGGQLLNVVVGGGKMYQDVNGHYKEHYAWDTRTEEPLMFSSIHHQMMVPGDKALILAAAAQSTRRLSYGVHVESEKSPIGIDPEAIFYKEQKAFCFQPHPEVGPDECTDWFFDRIDEFFDPDPVSSKLPAIRTAV